MASGEQQTTLQEQDGQASSPARLVLANADLLEIILRYCAGRQHTLCTFSQVCRDIQQACDEVQRRSVVKLEREVTVINFRSALATVRGWAQRLMGGATAACLNVRCWDGHDQPHLHNTLLFNSAVLQAASPTLHSLQLRLPHLLAPAADRLLALPALEGLTELRLQLDAWDEAEGSSAAERLQRDATCTAAVALARSVRAMTALQSLELQLPATECRRCEILAQLAPSLPPSLTSLAVTMGWDAEVPAARQQPGAQHNAALADLAHLHSVQRLRLHHMLSPDRSQALPAALAATLTSLEIVHQWCWGRSRPAWLCGLLIGRSVLPALRSMHLHGCHLGAASLAEAAPALQSLRLSCCQFSGSPRLEQTTALTRLVLERPFHDNEAEWVLHDTLLSLTALRSLSLKYCSLRPAGNGAAALPPLPQLTALHLRWCFVEAPVRLGNSPQLRDFQLRSFSWKEPCLVVLEQLEQLTRLRLDNSFAPLRLEQLQLMSELAVLEPPAWRRPAGWRPPRAADDAAAAGSSAAAAGGGAAAEAAGAAAGAAGGAAAAGGVAEADGAAEADSASSDPESRWDRDSDYEGVSEPDSEDEQWQIMTRQNRYLYT